jgi:hypothetical protein
MRAVRIATVLVLLLACKGDPASVGERAGQHTMADRDSAGAALAGGLEEAVSYLKDKPTDTAGALTRARAIIAHYYTQEEADAFQLHVGSGEWMLYIPASKPPTVWLARSQEHLIIDPESLSPEARKKIGL